MTAVLPLPTLSSRVVSGTVGPPVPGSVALGEELRHSLPPSLVEALDKIADQIRIEIVDPLLNAESDQDLAGIFERVFPKFRDRYVLSILILQGSLHEDVGQFSELTIRSFRESEDLIRSNGPQWIGQAATLNALQGLSTVARVVRAAIRLWQQGNLGEVGADRSQLNQWASSLLSYWMAYFAVHAALTLLASGQASSVRLDNVVALANRSNRFAVQAYHLSKIIGILKVPRVVGPIDPGSDEDLVLADAGLESYLEGLRQDDQP
jgi:hypothetical protein